MYNEHFNTMHLTLEIVGDGRQDGMIKINGCLSFGVEA